MSETNRLNVTLSWWSQGLCKVAYTAIVVALCTAAVSCQLIVSFTGSTESGIQCSDLVDNDGNGVTDCNDQGCVVESFCTADPVCGNGKVERGERCDDGDNIEDNGCTNQCTLSTKSCGNGLTEVDLGEQCDDGNTNNDDNCRNDCRFPSMLCGNGMMDPGEACDDGNADEVDCTNQCTRPIQWCGNGAIDEGEECDDGQDTPHCTMDCKRKRPVGTTCGNDRVEIGVEQCDGGAGCTADCKLKSDVVPQLISWIGDADATCSTSAEGGPIVDNVVAITPAGAATSPSRRVAVTPSGIAAVAMLCGSPGASKVWVSATTLTSSLFQKAKLVVLGGVVTDVEIAAGAGERLFLAAIVNGNLVVARSPDPSRDAWTTWNLPHGVMNGTLSDVSMAAAVAPGGFKRLVLLARGSENIGGTIKPFFFSWSFDNDDLVRMPQMAKHDNLPSQSFDLAINPTTNLPIFVGEEVPNNIVFRTGLDFSTAYNFTALVGKSALAVGNDRLLIVNSARATAQDVRWFSLLEGPDMGQVDDLELPPSAYGARRQIAANHAGQAFIITKTRLDPSLVDFPVISQFSSGPGMVSRAVQVAGDGEGASVAMPAISNSNSTTGVVAWTYRNQVFAARISSGP